MTKTRPNDSAVDGVNIVAFLNKSSGTEILLEKQYRPPIDRVVIELPAGLIDHGETIEQTAVRELKEETGYIGVVDKTTRIMYNDPGFCNANFNMVYVQVDMSLPENQNPKPELEDNEFIECFTVPVSGLFEELQRLEGEGYAIDARVGSIAEGIEIAKRLKI
ncbi:MutT/nudix family protein [Penicillium sp. DV-2018c]|nr:MutT/nudix family protein [Penicillium sp. DV-2018c]KAJ5567650.1 MutT/nudix family protein [Penicillium sp. DV-2018c]